MGKPGVGTGWGAVIMKSFVLDRVPLRHRGRSREGREWQSGYIQLPFIRTHAILGSQSSAWIEIPKRVSGNTGEPWSIPMAQANKEDEDPVRKLSGGTL